MGMGPIHCTLGFSVRRANSFSDQLERRCTAMSVHYREGYRDLLSSFDTLHDAVDAALTGDRPAADAALAGGLGELARAQDALAAMAEQLVRLRAELFEQGQRAPGDPLIAREPSFRRLDYEATYRELAAAGAALPQRAYWDEVVVRLRDGGARSGLRLLERHLRDLTSELAAFAADVGELRSLPLDRLALALHATSARVAAVLAGCTRLLTAATYLSILCERASELHERELDAPAVAAAG